MINEIIVFSVLFILLGITYKLTYKNQETFNNNYHDKPFVPLDELKSGNDELEKIRKINNALLKQNQHQQDKRSKAAEEYYKRAQLAEIHKQKEAKNKYIDDLAKWNKKDNDYETCMINEAILQKQNEEKKKQYVKNLALWHIKNDEYISCNKKEEEEEAEMKRKNLEAKMKAAVDVINVRRKKAGYKKAANSDSFGDDLGAFPGTVEQCKTICDDNDKCYGFLYLRYDKTCLLKNVNMYPKNAKQYYAGANFDLYYTSDVPMDEPTYNMTDVPMDEPTYNMTGHHELCPNPYGYRLGCGRGCVNIRQSDAGYWECTNPGGPWKKPDKCPPGYKLNSKYQCVSE